MTATGSRVPIRSACLESVNDQTWLLVTCYQASQSVLLPQLISERLLASLIDAQAEIIWTHSRGNEARFKFLLAPKYPLPKIMEVIVPYPPIPSYLSDHGWTVIGQSLTDGTAGLTVRRADRDPNKAALAIARLISAVRADGWKSIGWDSVPPFWIVRLTKQGEL